MRAIPARAQRTHARSPHERGLMNARACVCVVRVCHMLSVPDGESAYADLCAARCAGRLLRERARGSLRVSLRLASEPPLPCKRASSALQ
eukprot:353536-Chlamydomonas_euryale.AAC.10